MQMKDIRVGVEYGIVTTLNTKYSAQDPVAAKVVDMNAPYVYTRRIRFGGNNEEISEPSGGLKVEFTRETLDRGWAGYTQNPEIIARWRENPDVNGAWHDWKLVTEHTFHPKNTGKVSLGRYFAGLWADLEAKRIEREQYAADVAAKYERMADEFLPQLIEYRDLLAQAGIETTMIASSLYDSRASRTGRGTGFRLVLSQRDQKPTGFGRTVEIDREVFDRLIAIAVKHGETVA